MIFKRILLLCLILISGLSARSQTASGIQSIIASVDTLRSRMPAEKLYIQFDKPYYISGDTIRMKAYLFDAAMLKGSERSGIVYIELANDTNKVLFRRMLPVGYGLGTGNIVLNKEDIPEGSYTIRAYSNLMRNFGEDLVFKKDFFISGASAQNWLVNSQTLVSKQSGKDNARLGLQFIQFNKQALGLHELDLRILDGKKVLQRDKVKTDIEGKLDVNFNLPEKMEGKNLSMIAADANRKIVIPIAINRDENIDLQFMPEGGNLLTGFSSVVGFKAIGEDGRSAEVRGKIYSDKDNAEVANFSSSYKGMGSFEFTPEAGRIYTAKIDLIGSTKSFPMPEVKNAGTTIRVNNNAQSDSLDISISAAGAAASSAYYLTAQSRGIICYGAIIRFNGTQTNTRKIAKDLFPTGIARFRLMTADKQPLNERITFIDHQDNLNIEINPSQPGYQTRDSIALAIEVKDQEGTPVEGSFSLAVTDDSQIRTDSLSSNILSSLLLTSDLKGTVEYPAHYFGKSKQAQKDLDNLLLTQGWVAYTWKDVFNPPEALVFQAEPEFVVSGKVTNAFNKGSAMTGIQLLSLKPAVTEKGLTGKDGSFAFGGLPVAEDMKFFLQAKNKSNKSFNVGIEIDEFKPAEFKSPDRHYLPWYVNSDTLLLRQVIISAAQEAMSKRKGVNLLQEVTVTAKKVVKDSKNLNGAGEADQILDEKDMAKDPKRSLLDLMKESVKGFNEGLWPTTNTPLAGLTKRPGTFVPGRAAASGSGSRFSLGTAPYHFEKVMSYKINDKEMHLVIDGIDVEALYSPDRGGFWRNTTDDQLMAQRTVDPDGDYILERNAAPQDDRLKFIRLYLDGILAEDIKGIEVMYDPEFNMRYKTKYASKILGSLSPATADFAYVEVTTYSGNGAFVKTPPGVYLHKPISYVNTTAFYRPRYLVKTNPLIDFRSTIHWEPDIVTDKEGKATVSFYSADRPGTYSIIMEGSDMKGSVGRKMGTITIR